MRFLFCNNSSSVVGGTLQSTHSQIAALPDQQHAVFSFGSPFMPEAREYFGNTQLLSGMNLKDAFREINPDIIVYQNTADNRVAPTPPSGALTIYYQHSFTGSSNRARTRCHLQLCVSKWLADACKMPHSTVLHQPVTLPEKFTERSADKFALLVMATPHNSKWKSEDIVPHLTVAINEVDSLVMFGVPEAMQCEYKEFGDVYSATTAARSNLWHSHAILGASSVCESFGRTVREAQRCGCVPIGRRQGGLVEQIESPDGLQGCFIDTPDDTVAAIRRIKSDPGMSARVKKWGDETGSLQVWRTEFLKRVSEVLK